MLVSKLDWSLSPNISLSLRVDFYVFANITICRFHASLRTHLADGARVVGGGGGESAAGQGAPGVGGGGQVGGLVGGGQQGEAPQRTHQR